MAVLNFRLLQNLIKFYATEIKLYIIVRSRFLSLFFSSTDDSFFFKIM